MSRKRNHSARRALTGATVLVLCLWPNPRARAAPTVLLRFEHCGREAGITVNDCLRLRVAGFTWSDGTVDLLREPAGHVAPPHPYVTGGSDNVVPLEMPAVRYALHLSDTPESAATDRAEMFDTAIPQPAEKWLRTSNESLPARVMHLMETSSAPAVWSSEIPR